MGFAFVGGLGAEGFAVEVAEGDAGAFERLRVTRGGAVDLTGIPKMVAMFAGERERCERKTEDNTDKKRVLCPREIPRNEFERMNGCSRCESVHERSVQDATEGIQSPIFHLHEILNTFIPFLLSVYVYFALLFRSV